MKTLVLVVELINGVGIEPPVALEAVDVVGDSFKAVWAKEFSGSFLFTLAKDVDFLEGVPGYVEVPVAEKSLVVVGLTPGSDYYYKVVAVFGSLVSGDSNIVKVTTLVE